MFRVFIALCCLLALCGCKEHRRVTLSIGIDPTWYPLPLGKKAANLTAFIDVVTQEIAREESLPIIITHSDPLQLFTDLETRRFAAVFASLTLNLITLSKYSFSQPLILLGPVLIVPWHSTATSLTDLREKIVGVNEFDNSELLVQAIPSIVIRLYQNMPVALEDLTYGEIDAVLLDTLNANAWIPTVYRGRLQIVTPPLNDKGIRLVTLKGENSELIEKFERGLKKLHSSGRYEKLRKKFKIE